MKLPSPHKVLKNSIDIVTTPQTVLSRLPLSFKKQTTALPSPAMPLIDIPINVEYGGTGQSTLSGLLKGNAQNPVQTATPDSDYTVPGTTQDNLIYI